MEARFNRVVPAMTLLVGLAALPLGSSADAAGYKTTNFEVSAPTAALAKEIGDQAEVCRRELAVVWLGKELPPWAKPCPIHAKVEQSLGAGGATSFVFHKGEVFNWKMNIQGSRERILDSVLPHEVTHTIFASHFRQPLPRWADEGACTTVEHSSEIAKQESNLIKFLRTGQGIPFPQMFAMTEYPQNVMPLYAQGHSLTEWLIEARGREAFLTFLADGMRDDNWERAVHQHYGYTDLLTMQNAWNDWVRQGRPQLKSVTSPAIQLAANTSGAGNAQSADGTQAILRTQSPDSVTPNTSSVDNDKTGPVTVASARVSVYAAAAEQAARARRDSKASTGASGSNATVYDASRGGRMLK